jgi:hypothetical protein
MSGTPHKKSPEELRAERLKNIAKARAARMANARKRHAPACHPERKQVGKTGLCHECYVGGERGKQDITIKDALATVDKLSDPVMAEAVREQALTVLLQSLPEYARLHLQAAREAALKGNASPAEWALTTVKRLGESAVVEPAQKGLPAGQGGVKILIGVKLGGVSDSAPASSKEVTASAVTGVLTE